METTRDPAAIDARLDEISAERADIDLRWSDDAYQTHAQRGEALASLARLSKEFDELFELTPEGKAASETVLHHGVHTEADLDRMLMIQQFPQLGSQSQASEGPLWKGVAAFLIGMAIIASTKQKSRAPVASAADQFLTSTESEFEVFSDRLAKELHLDAQEVWARAEAAARNHARDSIYAAPVR